MRFFERMREILFREKQRAKIDYPPLKRHRYTRQIRKSKEKVFPIAHRTLKSLYAGQFMPFSLKHRYGPRKRKLAA